MFYNTNVIFGINSYNLFEFITFTNKYAKKRSPALLKNIFKKLKLFRHVNFLLNNQGLQWSLRQQFRLGSSYRNLEDMKNALRRYGYVTCVKHPCEFDAETHTLDCSHRF